MTIHQIFYRGRSMRGTFIDGDYLQVSKIKDLKPGDIVVFKKPFNDEENKEFIVHRVTSIHKSAITTMGDYNLFEDKHTLNADHLLGKVLSYERKGRNLKVANGFLGLLQSKRVRMELLTKKQILYIARPIYSLIKKTGLVPKFWKPDLKTIVLGSNKGQKIKYTHHGKTVLILEGKHIIFRRRPYDLLF